MNAKKMFALLLIAGAADAVFGRLRRKEGREHGQYEQHG